jgi:hypothetical protein
LWSWMTQPAAMSIASICWRACCSGVIKGAERRLQEASCAEPLSTSSPPSDRTRAIWISSADPNKLFLQQSQCPTYAHASASAVWNRFRQGSPLNVLNGGVPALRFEGETGGTVSVQFGATARRSPLEAEVPGAGVWHPATHRVFSAKKCRHPRQKACKNRRVRNLLTAKSPVSAEKFYFLVNWFHKKPNWFHFLPNYFRSRVELVPEEVRRVLLFWELVSLFPK